MPRRAARPTLALLAVLCCLGACRPTTTLAQAPTPTASPTLAPTATATSTAATITQVPFTCPEVVTGARKVFDDAATGLHFSYPAAWTEHECVRYSSTDGTGSVLVGNLFFVGISPRNGLTIQQWVARNVDPQIEQDTLTPLSVAHAADAVSVRVSSVPGASRPPSQIAAIVLGDKQIYVVSPLIAQMSMTDTIPPLSHDQLVQQVVATFDVP